MRYRGAIGWLVGLTVILAAPQPQSRPRNGPWSLMLALPSTALAATVTTTADSGAGSLRAAIAASAAGDTINFDPSLNGQTITLTSGALMISHTLTISGPGAGDLTVNGNNLSSVFDIDTPVGSHSSVTISGLTITGGKGATPAGAESSRTPSTPSR